MSAASAVSLLILTCALTAGHARIIRPFSPLFKTSSLSVTKNTCSDCTKIMELFSDMLSHPDTQHLIQGTLDDFCQRLPIESVNDCMNFMEKYLPVFIQGFITFTAHKEGEICMVLGLCAVQSEHKTPELLNFGLQEAEFIQLQPSTRTSHELQISPQCTFCLFLIKKLEDLLPKERTEESVVNLLEKICDHLPDHYKEQCNNFLEKYGKQIIDFLLTSATPHTICTLLHLCFGQDTPALVPSLPSDCKTCRTLMILTQIHLGHNSSETQMMSMLWRTCHLHPNALPGCELFIQGHVTALVNILSKNEEAVNACQKIFCVGQE
ncbi:surfactant protein Bb isoform X2 [Clarias gariepinus]|uniref:surfactant protein Bb isoform X2 n=1 Tax=Clarias gariepinus TaxID=13013 RepID=UPI00234D77C8|nr:surfactant protein Bb isoform X2 [Clarias gariepinus]